ncbi:alpha/beta hydrolase family protein [Dinoroseobacter sp. S124A]|uniref:alpha/beta hydrolase family protein n=1 Tax=Dinoroseobacter sp. S124A TaxID=3415128 RepID=UPI003C7CB116
MSAEIVKSATGNLNVVIRESEGALGTLLCLHGGPQGDLRGNENIFDEISKYAVQDGFWVCQFDFFGSGSSDGSQRDFDLETMRQDYSAMLDFVRQRCPNPLIVVGESMGATVAALDWSQQAERHVFLWPAFDLTDTDLKPFLSGEHYDIAQKNGYVDVDGMEMGGAFLRQINECDFSTFFSLPAHDCLLIHGKADSAVPFQQSVRGAIEARGPVELHLHPDGDHGLQSSSERQYTHQIVRRWLSS